MTVIPSPSVAVLGCGYWGSNLVRVFSELGALVALYDSDAPRADELALRFDVPHRPLGEILADPGITAVVIATPAVTHAALARDALLAGKDVFVEKPVALSVEDGEDLCRLALENSRILMVGHLMQYHAGFRKLSELVRTGQLGRIQYLYSNRLNFGRFRREENILWSFAPHDISMILSLVGSVPDRVTTVAANYLHERVADVTTTHLAFPGGERAHIFVSWLHPYKEQRLVVVGDRGMAVLDDGQPWNSKLRIYPHQVSWKDGLPNPAHAPWENVAVAESEPLTDECSHFLESIVRRSPPRTDGEEGLRVLEVLRMAQRSMAETAKASSATPGIDRTAVVDDDVQIGPGTLVWHFSHILSGSRVGSGCTIGQNVMIGPDVTVGDNCKIQNNVSLYKGVSLERGVFCGPSAVFTNVVTPRAEVDRRGEMASTLVRTGASIGANATIVCGNTIGEYSMIGAGAVVTSDVPAHALMVGVPARRIGWVSHAGERLGPDLVCPRTGRKYQEIDGQLSEVAQHGS